MAQVQPRQNTTACEGCGTTGPRHEFHHGRYCSNRCEYQAQGRSLINRIEADARYCATCYGHLRDVEPLPDLTVEGPDHPTHEDDQGWRNVADGLQHGTDRLTHGIDARDGPHGYYEFQRESCACGNVDPSQTTAELQRVDLDAVRANLFVALAWVCEQDADLPTPDRERYARSLAERPYDAALAVGRSVWGGD